MVLIKSIYFVSLLLITAIVVSAQAQENFVLFKKLPKISNIKTQDEYKNTESDKSLPTHVKIARYYQAKSKEQNEEAELEQLKLDLLEEILNFINENDKNKDKNVKNIDENNIEDYGEVLETVVNVKKDKRDLKTVGFTKSPQVLRSNFEGGLCPSGKFKVKGVCLHTDNK